MKGNGIGKAGKVGAAVVALVGLAFGDVRADGFTALDAAWKEAVILAGVAETSVRRPQIVYRGAGAEGSEATAVKYISGVNEVRVYASDGRPPYYSMVQEFLSSIFDQTRSASLASYAPGQADPKVSWVKEKMGWRVRSRAFSQSSSLN